MTHEQLVLASACAGALVLVNSTDGIGQIRRIVSQHRFWRAHGKGIGIGPEWLPDDARLRHTHIVGSTGTGKTVLIEKLLFEDLKRGYGAVVIDPKGELSFYNSVKAYCESIGRAQDLYLLSATNPSESAIWNPCGLGNASELQTKFFNSSVYNEPHYAKACEFGLLKAFKRLTTIHTYGFTVRDLLKELEALAKDEKDNTLQGLFYDLNNLAQGEWEQLLACGVRKQIDVKKEISILDLISNNKILFVDLPTEGKKVQSSRIGRLLTQEIILISGMRKRNPSLKGDKPFSVYIDEFDAFATESFATFLNKGRSSDFMIHLAHQTLSDLNCVSPEFTGQILGNCNVRFIFRQDDPDDAERWSRFFGTSKNTKLTTRIKDGSQTRDASAREVQEFVIPPDEIKSLRVGQCVFSMKTEGVTRRLAVPYKKAVNTVVGDGFGVNTSEPSMPEQRGVGNRTTRELSAKELNPGVPLAVAKQTKAEQVATHIKPQDPWDLFQVQKMEESK